MSSKLRVMLADDHVLVREGLKRLVDEQPDMEVVGEAGDGPDALRECQSLLPDIAVIDVSMPTWDGVKTAQALRAACPRMKIVSVTRHDDESFVKRMFAAGVTGYVCKQSSSSLMTTAIRAVARGEHFVDPSIRRRGDPGTSAASGVINPAQQTPSLTEAEQQVVRLVAMSHSSREIGEQLGLDSTAVTAIKRSAMSKLDLETRIQLIDYARQRGWL